MCQALRWVLCVSLYPILILITPLIICIRVLLQPVGATVKPPNPCLTTQESCGLGKVKNTDLFLCYCED